MLTIGIPTREGMYYKELFCSLSKAIQFFSIKKWKVETLVCINGPRIDSLEIEIKAIARGIPELNIRVLKQKASLVGKVFAMKRIVTEAKGRFVLFLDDDVEIAVDAIMIALKVFETKPNIKLVGATQKIIRPISASLWRNFVYDVINIQQITDVFAHPDPFVFGRFMMIKKKDILDIPDDILNEDMYIQILFHPNVVKVMSSVQYHGVAHLRAHFKRVFRLIEGRKQAKEYAGETLTKKYFNDSFTKRRLSFKKIIHLKPYFLFCFLCYRTIRILTYLLKPFFYKKSLTTGWSRTDSRQIDVIIKNK